MQIKKLKNDYLSLIYNFIEQDVKNLILKLNSLEAIKQEETDKIPIIQTRQVDNLKQELKKEHRNQLRTYLKKRYRI